MKAQIIPFLAIMAALAFAAAPAIAAQPQPGATPQQQAAVTGQNPGTPAIVTGVDQPDNCLRIRSGPSTSTQIIGCAKMGTQLFLTGVFSNDGRWAQLNNKGWVYYNQLQSSLKPKYTSTAGKAKSSENVEIWEVPAGTNYDDYDYWPGYYRHRRFYGHPFHYGHKFH